MELKSNIKEILFLIVRSLLSSYQLLLSALSDKSQLLPVRSGSCQAGIMRLIWLNIQRELVMGIIY
jgi:hypothetical protein